MRLRIHDERGSVRPSRSLGGGMAASFPIHRESAAGRNAPAPEGWARGLGATLPVVVATLDGVGPDGYCL